MEIDRRELKRQARERMGQTSPRFWVVALVYFLMTTGVSTAVDCIPFATDSVLGISTIGLFATILVTLYTYVVAFGYTLWSLWTWRQLDPDLYSLTEGFSVAGRVLLMELGILVRVLGWTFLASIGCGLLLLVTPNEVGYLVMVAVLYAVIFALMLQYSLAPYLLADHPDDGATSAIHRSVELMRGWKWELFKLEFSFIGWDLLNILIALVVMVAFLVGSGTLGAVFTLDVEYLYQFYLTGDGTILYALVSALASLPVFLWLTPYRTVAQAGFYDARLRHQQQSAAQEMPPL